MAAAKTATTKTLDIKQFTRGSMKAYLLGASPLVMNRFSQKACRELLLGNLPKNAAEKQASLKHDPVGEFRAAIYANRDPSRPTFCHFPADAFKEAISNSAKDLPGSSKSQIDRLVNMAGTQVDLYGVPQLYTRMVRSADINRTPDMRTRAIFPRWACVIDLAFVTPLLNPTQIMNLLFNAGMTIGIGDGRPEKGKAFGQFVITEQNDPEFRDIVKKEGRKAQLAAIQTPQRYDDETEELLQWYDEEVVRRGKTPESTIADFALETTLN